MSMTSEIDPNVVDDTFAMRDELTTPAIRKEIYKRILSGLFDRSVNTTQYVNKRRQQAMRDRHVKGSQAKLLSSPNDTGVIVLDRGTMDGRNFAHVGRLFVHDFPVGYSGKKEYRPVTYLSGLAVPLEAAVQDEEELSTEMLASLGHHVGPLITGRLVFVNWQNKITTDNDAIYSLMVDNFKPKVEIPEMALVEQVEAGRSAIMDKISAGVESYVMKQQYATTAATQQI